MIPEHLIQFTQEPIKVLDDGHVLLVDVMGSDQAIVDAARVSYGAGTKQVSRDRTLIRYLLRHQHTSPFEMCEIKFRLRVPMDCWRQIVRHRTASINEYSTRYSEAVDSCQKTPPDQWRLQAIDNKQGSLGSLTEWPDDYLNLADSPGDYLSEREQTLQKIARNVYDERLKFGVAREQARKDLPLSTYTEAYWKIDLKNLLNFLSLRMDHHAQQEVREYAYAMSEIVKAWVPLTWEAFEDYDVRQKGLLLSKMEARGIIRAMAVISRVPASEMLKIAIKESGLTGLEAKEFETKIRNLL